MKKLEEKRRSFGGKLEYLKDKLERAFEKKHLAAYLKGNTKFRFGKNSKGFPMYYDVKEIWT